jgi:hypothetical protein
MTRKRLARFQDFIAEKDHTQLRRMELAELLCPEMRSFCDFILSETGEDEYHASLRLDNSNPRFSTEMLARDREQVRNKKRRKITNLPVDMTKSGEFPQRESCDYESRWHDLISIMEHLNEEQRPIVAAECKRLMRAARNSRSTIDLLATLSGAKRHGT